MSRPSSRDHILRTARQMIEARAGSPVTITEVAEEAGLSRQAIYLHFDGIGDLLLHLAQTADMSARTADLQQTIDEAPTGRQALRNAVAVQGAIKPQLHSLVTAVDILRRSHPEAQAVFEDREAARYRRVEAVVQRLADEGELAREWNVPTATRLAWATMSQRVWEDLGCPSPDEYADQLSRFLESALCAPRSDEAAARSASDPRDA